MVDRLASHNRLVVAVNVQVCMLAVATLDISPDFVALSGYGAVISLNTFGVLGAVIVFAVGLLFGIGVG